ncbi:MAG: hypothetical protein ABW352_25460 [Polyangiales bacterium]
MPALKRALLLVLLSACEGPNLYLGDYELPVLDASKVDEDAGRDARVIERDAQLTDGRIIVIIPQRCADNSDCRDSRWPRCNTNFYFCTNCQFDRDCRQHEYCDPSDYAWQCRDKDERKDEPGGPMGDGP